MFHKICMSNKRIGSLRGVCARCTPLNLPMYKDGDLVLNKGYEPQFSTKMMNSISTVPSCAAHRFKRTTLNQYYFETN